MSSVVTNASVSFSSYLISSFLSYNKIHKGKEILFLILAIDYNAKFKF